MEDFSGIPWIVIHAGIAVLGAVLIYGILRGRPLNRTQKAAQQNQVRENFRQDADDK